MVRRREGSSVVRRAVPGSLPFGRPTCLRQRVVRGSIIVLLAWIAAFLLIVGTARSVAFAVVVSGLGVGFLLGLSQFAFAWLLTWRHLRASNRLVAETEAEAERSARFGEVRDRSRAGLGSGRALAH